MTLVPCEILKTFKYRRDTFSEGELRMVPPDTLEFFCRAGWAKDPSGAIATRNPGPHERVLEVEAVQQAETNEVV